MVGDVAQACESCPIRVDLAFQGCGALKRQALRQSVQTDGTQRCCSNEQYIKELHLSHVDTRNENYEPENEHGMVPF